MENQTSTLSTVIDTFTQKKEDLIQLLKDKNLWSNDLDLDAIQTKISRTIHNKFKRQEDLTRKLTLREADLAQVSEEWAIANQHYQSRQTRLDKMQQDQKAAETHLSVLNQKKTSHQEEFEKEQEGRSTKHTEIKEEIFNTIQHIVDIRQDIETRQQNIATFQGQIDDLFTQKIHHQNLVNHHHHYRHRWGIVGRDKSGRPRHGWIPNPEHIRLRDQHRQTVTQLQQNINTLNQQQIELRDTLERERPGLESQMEALGNELGAYQREFGYQEYLVEIQDQEFEQLIETLDVQIEQVTTDLSQLEQDIGEQTRITDIAQQRADLAQEALERSQTNRDQAQSILENFSDTNQILLSPDTSLETFQEDEQLIKRFPGYYQLLVLQEVEEISDRLTTIQSQVEVEEAIAQAVETESINDYKVLTDTLNQEVKDTTEDAIEILEVNYDSTVDLWRKSQNYSTEVEDLETFIFDTLADPYEDHYLNQAQLNEAVQRQAGQIAYQDALAASVDSTEETVELLQLQVKHIEELAQKLGHLQDLVHYEEQSVEMGKIEAQIQTILKAYEALDWIYQTIPKAINENRKDDLAQLIGWSKGNQSRLYTTLNEFVISLRKTDFLPDEILNQVEDYVARFNTIQENKDSKLTQVREGVVQGIIDDESYLQKLYGVETFAAKKTGYAHGFTVGRGGWTSQDQYPRQLADVNGDGRADIVGFSHDMVVVSLGQENGTFATPTIGIRGNFTTIDGWASQNTYPRQLADINGDGRADIVAFGENAVEVSLGQEDGTFAPPNADYRQSFTTATGWANQNQYPRQLADVNGDGRADIVGFGPNFVTVAFADETGSFSAPQIAYSSSLVGSSWNESQYPRQLADINGDGRADIVAFSNSVVIAALAKEDGTFAPSNTIDGLRFTVGIGGWASQDKYPRQVVDVNGDGRADIVGFASPYVVVSLAQDDGTFANRQILLHDYSIRQGWSGQNKYPRQLADVNGDGRVDIVGFSHDGVQVSLSNVKQKQQDELKDILEIQAGSASYHDAVAPLAAYLDEIEDHANDYKTIIVQPQLAAQLDQEITLQIEELEEDIDLIDDQQEQRLETGLEDYFEFRQELISAVKLVGIISESQAIDDQQFLRMEIAHLTLLAERDAQKLLDYLNEYEQIKAKGFATPEIRAAAHRDTKVLRDRYFPGLNEAETLANLRTEIAEEVTTHQGELDRIKVAISQAQAASTAALSQATWYEEQAGIHWHKSRKQGPTWNEYRTTWKRDKSGRRKSHTVTITHVDHNWIIWNNYTKQAAQLRDYAQKLAQQINEGEIERDIVSDVLDQWQSANAVADEAQLTYEELKAVLEGLETEFELSAAQKTQLSTFEQLLPILRAQLDKAKDQTAKTNNAVEREWLEYQGSSDAYEDAIATVIEEKATVDRQAQTLLSQLANQEQWVKQQLNSLDADIQHIQTSKATLKTALDDLVAEGETDPDRAAQQVDLETALQRLTQQEAILTAEKASLEQKQTLLEAQRQLVLSEQDLLNAYLDSPDDDYSTLEAQLRDAQTLVVTVQALTEQAEAHSTALKEALGNVAATLDQQTGAYLDAIKQKHQALADLVEAAELETQYNQQKVNILQTLNALEADLLVRLQEAADAGNQEAQHLLNVAQFTNFAAAAEIYHRDYRDLMSDTGARCSGGIARPEDITNANRYYEEMIKYRELGQQARSQANYFAQVKAAAEEQVRLIKTEQAEIQDDLKGLRGRLDRVEGNISELQQEITLAELQVDTLQQLRTWTQQTLVQLAEVEKLNLAQVQLERQFLDQRQEAIDDAITARVDRDRLAIERDFNLATAQLERLNQFQTIDDLEETLQSVQLGLGEAIAEDLVDGEAIADQLIGVKAQLDTLIQEAILPPEIQALLDEVGKDIGGVIEGDPSIDTIQDNLVTVANALLEQGNRINADLTQITEEETAYRAILAQSETDLKAATKSLYEEIVRSQALDDQTEAVSQEYLTALHKVGYAEGAIDLSSDLAKFSKRALEDIIDQRIEERITRKKFFLNDLLSTVTTALGLVSTILQFTPLAPIGTALGAASGILGAIQSAYNGDWAGAIFKVSMAVVSYGISTTSAKLDVAKEALNIATSTDDITAAQAAVKSLTTALHGFRTVKIVATAAYHGYQAVESEDNTLALLYAVKGVADVIGENFKLSSIPGNILLTAGQVSVTAYKGIQAIENGDLLDVGETILAIGKVINKNFFQNPALNPPSGSSSGNGSSNGNTIPNNPSIFQDIFDFGKGIATDVDNFLQNNFGITFDDISKLYKNGEKVYKTIDSLIGAYKTGGLDAWLQSLDSVLNIWKTDIEEFVDGLIYDAEILELSDSLNISPENLEIQDNGDIFFIGPDDISILVGFIREKQVAEAIDQLSPWDQYHVLASLNDDLRIEVIEYLQQKYETSENWENEHPILIAGPLPDGGVIVQTDKAKSLIFEENSFIEKIDWEFFGGREGEELSGYIPQKTNGTILGNSGVTISVGFDLGQHSETDLRKMGFPSGLINKFKPYLNLKKESARQALITHGIPQINQNESNLVYYLKRSDTVKKLAVDYNQESTAIKFEDLDPAIQTVITSVSYQYGDLKQATPMFWKSITQQDWKGTVNELRNFGDNFSPRRNEEADYLEEHLLNIQKLKDPIVLDLNNDGISLISLEQSSVEFDMDNDGVSDRTGWLSPDDGFLAHDRNGDGEINDITELFSEHHSPGANTGLQALATLDSNDDQRIDIQDAAFLELSVWRDRNTNGTTDPDELLSLEEVGISAIALNSTPVNETLDGNILLSTTHAQRSDGVAIAAVEVAFLVNPSASAPDELIGEINKNGAKFSDHSPDRSITESTVNPYHLNSNAYSNGGMQTYHHGTTMPWDLTTDTTTSLATWEISRVGGIEG